MSSEPLTDEKQLSDLIIRTFTAPSTPSSCSLTPTLASCVLMHGEVGLVDLMVKDGEGPHLAGYHDSGFERKQFRPQYWKCGNTINSFTPGDNSD